MRMEKKKRNRFLVAWLGLIVLTLVAVLAVGGGGESVSIKETMRDAVLHLSLIHISEPTRPY